MQPKRPLLGPFSGHCKRRFVDTSKCTGYRLTLLALCLGAGAANAYVMYKQVCQPGTFKIRNLDEMEPPEDVKIQTAFKIVKMKADVKEAANTSASSA